MYNEVRRVIRHKKKHLKPEDFKKYNKRSNENSLSLSNAEQSCASANLKKQKRKAEIMKYRLEGMEVDKFEERTRKAKERLIRKMVNNNKFQTASLDQVFGTNRNKNRNKIAQYDFFE